MNMLRRKVRLILLSKPVWMMMGSENRKNIEKSIDCWGNWIRQYKKTLSRVSGKGKKKYHPYGCVDRYKGAEGTILVWKNSVNMRRV